METQDINAGRPVELDPVIASPNDIVQLFYHAAGGEILRGLSVSPGCVIKQVLVGREKFPSNVAPTDDGTQWKACIGKQVPPGSYVIALVQNTTADVVHVKGCWLVTDGAGATPAPQPAPQPAPPVVAPAAVIPQQHFAPPAVAQVVGAPFAEGVNAPSSGAAVKPGANEVAVLLTRNEAQMLLWNLPNGAVPSYIIPSVIRRLQTALQT